MSESSSIWKAYVSLGRDESGVQVYEVPVRPVARTSTSTRLVEGPSFRVMVTGPSASVQVSVKLLPAVTVTVSLRVS